jgi:hypothetical protein
MTWQMESQSSPNPTASTRWAYGPLKPSLLNNKGPVAFLYPIQPTQGPHGLLQTSQLPHNGLTAHYKHYVKEKAWRSCFHYKHMLYIFFIKKAMP